MSYLKEDTLRKVKLVAILRNRNVNDILINMQQEVASPGSIYWIPIKPRFLETNFLISNSEILVVWFSKILNSLLFN